MNKPQIQSMSPRMLGILEQHISNEKLPDDFIQTVKNYFWPIVCDVVEEFDATAGSLKSGINKPYFLGIQGTQGSGKSTFASFIKRILEEEFGKKCLVLSLDDFYLTKAERITLSQDVHPLLLTRGVPGTHDINLLLQTLKEVNSLKTEKTGQTVNVVTFNKALDDRAVPAEWQSVATPQDVVILEGWCVGVSAQTQQALVEPINQLEANEDIDGQWRGHVNQQIGQHYQSLYDQFDGLAVLLAPSFECVFQWRTKQEQKLIDKLMTVNKPLNDTMSPADIKRFISHYQRLTEHGLSTLPAQANWQLILQPNHVITELIRSR